MTTKNKKVLSWFETGKISEALEGEGKFFLPDVTFREVHDILLVLRQLLEWAVEDRIESASAGFTCYLQRLLDQNDLHKGLELYHSYRIIVESGRRELIIDEGKLRNEFVHSIERNVNRLTSDAVLRNAVVRFLDSFPDLKSQVGMENSRDP